METIQLLGTAMGLGFVSGLNLYATVLAVGLGINLGLIHLSPHLAGLAVLGEPMIIVVAGVMYAVEFFADKVPWVDSAWDSLHTFIRPIGAAWLGAVALGHVDPALEVVAVLLAGGAALSTHVTKAGVRLVANTSPEPFSNIGLSLAEDAVAVSGAWLALAHPQIAGAAAALFLALFLVLAPRLFRLMRVQLLGAAALVRAWLGRSRAADDRFDALPGWAVERLGAAFGAPADFAVRCVSGRGPLGANHVAFLCLGGGALRLLARRWGRVREHPMDLARVQEVRVHHGFVFDRLSLRSGGTTAHVYLFRDRRPSLEALRQRLDEARAGVPVHA